MDSQGISRSRVRPLILLGALVVTLVAALVFALRAGDDAEAQSIRNVRVVIKCTTAVPSSSATCRGTFTMTGGFRDRGRVSIESVSRTEGAFFASGSYLRGRRSRLYLSSGNLGVSHRRRGCPASTTFYLGNSSNTGGYRGWSGSSEGSCSKASFRRGRMSRTDVFRVALR
jgi:hypothetical protein